MEKAANPFLYVGEEVMMKKEALKTGILNALHGVDPKTAREDACKMEHDLSDKTYNAICAHARAHMK
mgnify:CR=1 FL=1